MAKFSLSRAAKLKGHHKPPNPKSRGAGPKASAPAKAPTAPKGPVAKAFAAVSEAAGAVQERVVEPVVEVVRERVVKPVAASVRPSKTKRTRYVRSKAEARPEAAAALPARSKKASGKLMTKNLAVPPKEERTRPG